MDASQIPQADWMRFDRKGKSRRWRMARLKSFISGSFCMGMVLHFGATHAIGQTPSKPTRIVYEPSQPPMPLVRFAASDPTRLEEGEEKFGNVNIGWDGLGKTDRDTSLRKNQLEKETISSWIPKDRIDGMHESISGLANTGFSEVGAKPVMSRSLNTMRPQTRETVSTLTTISSPVPYPGVDRANPIPTLSPAKTESHSNPVDYLYSSGSVEVRILEAMQNSELSVEPIQESNEEPKEESSKSLKNQPYPSYFPTQKPISNIDINVAAKEKSGSNTIPEDLASSVQGVVPVIYGATAAELDQGGVSIGSPGTQIAYQPLYFEEVNLERHGTEYCRFGTAASIARFYATIPALPYAMTVHKPSRPLYWNWPYESGWCAPKVRELPPFHCKAGMVEAGAVTGLIFLVP